MASLDLNHTVQLPALTHTPTPLPLPKVQQGGLFHGGRLSWSVGNGVLYVSNTSTGNCLQNWAPSSPGEEVTIVSELRGPKGSLLVVALEGYGCHMIGVLSSNWGKLIRGVSVPDKITSLHPFNFDGFSKQCDESYRRPDILPTSVLSLFNGIVAIGTVGGRSYLVDLQLGLGASSDDCLNNPSPLHTIEGPVTEGDIASMSESGHVTVEISKGRFQRGKFIYDQSLLSTSSVIVTAMYFAPQISALFVGYSFGGFQMYDLSSFQLLHTCAVSAPLPPVTHFTYVEPENDPRKFVYVWVMRGNSRFVEGTSCGASAYLYQMIFAEKTNGPGGHTHYRGFQGCGLRFEHILNDNPHSVMERIGSRVLTCATPTRHRQEQPGHSLELDLSQAVLVWMVPSQTSNSEVDWSVFVGLFDVNQWYHSQMPRCIRWKAKGKYTGVFGCSYLSFYNVSSALPASSDSTVMDVLVERLLPFYSNPPMPETFMWPSAAQFNLKILTDSSLAACQCLGIQRMVLRQLDECRGSLYAQPEVLFQLCAHTELLPPSYDHTPSRNLSSQRAALLGVVISHGAHTRILTSFADSWAGAGGDDPVISQWVESTRTELEQTKKLIYAKCFSEDPSPTPLSGHWRRMAAIEVFLERLLSRGFQMEGRRTGVLYQAVGQLRLMVARHKKVMEVIRFLNEEGLACDYPAAALKRRYDMLRGGSELGNKLAIDCLIEDHHGNGDDSAPLYPPLSLLNYMEFLMTFDPLIQHCLVLYLLADLGSLTTPPHSPQCRYAASHELPSDLLNTMHSLWLVDNVKFKDPAYQREANVLFMRTSPHSLFPWQHGVILERLMQYGEVEGALSYLQTHGQTMQGLEELKLKIGVYVGNSLVTPAYHLLSQFEGSENYDQLFKFFLECCVEGKCLNLILDLPLSSLAETTAVLYLEQHTQLICRELLVFYFATRHRFVEALAMQENIRPFAKSDPDPNAMVKCGQRDTLLAGLASVVPSSLHHVKLTHDDLRGQSSKVKVQVDKSLSSVVAKAVKYEGVAGGGGEVYSLIQTLAEKRLAPSDPMTPIRPSRTSVTVLSHTPFLSTPVSVKKIRVPMTGSRPHPVLTPTPRSRPLTPHQSHTHQQFVSHIQSFKDRMASMLSHSGTRGLDLSGVQTPSPMKAGQLLRPVLTPTSILKGSRSASKLTDKRIRFAVESSPSPEKERPRQVYTPFAPSSLSTTTSIAMTTPLPSSEDDDDVYESPVESPSQLHTPTPSQLYTPAHSPPRLPTKLDYHDAENTPTKETAAITIETSDSSSSEDDTDEMDNSIAEEDVSIVEQEVSDEETSILQISQPVGNISGPAPTKTSPFQDIALTREKLVSSVSPKHDPKTREMKPSLSSPAGTFRLPRGGLSSSVLLKHESSVGSTNTFSSPFTRNPQNTTPAVSNSRLFAPVTKAMTPASQFFSPVPYLSDLIQAKKDKLHSSFQQLKQRDLDNIKTPQRTTSPMVNQSSFSASMVPSVGVATGSSYNFSPPTQVQVDAHTINVTPPEDSESMSFVFSPPLTRSAARRKRDDSFSVSRESSVEPTLPPSGGSEVRRKSRGRPRKVPLPPNDDPVTLVTPPTAPRLLREQPKKSKPRVKSGMASRRSARLLSGKK